MGTSGVDEEEEGGCHHAAGDMASIRHDTAAAMCV